MTTTSILVIGKRYGEITIQRQYYVDHIAWLTCLCHTCGLTHERKRSYLGRYIHHAAAQGYVVQCPGCNAQKRDDRHKRYRMPAAGSPAKARKFSCYECYDQAHRSCRFCQRVAVPEKLERATGWERTEDVMGGTWR